MGEIRSKCKISLQCSCVCVMVIEALAVSHGIVFSIANLIQGKDHYEDIYGYFSQIILFDYLFPLTIIQILWVTTNILALLAIKFTIPYLILPYSVMSAVALGVVFLFLVFVVEQLVTRPEWSWPGPVLVLIFTLFIILQMYFSGIRIRCFRYLVKRKKAVQGTAEEKPNVADSDKFHSFSRRSTIIITDEGYEPPPKI
ncbi:unnamed protein product [Auanema sp. JU1783]|nr:unnamed protein product [Auanema sp. JU1783]